MTDHTDPILDLQTLAALYVSGAVTPQEHAEFKARLQAGDVQSLAELKSLEPAVEALISALPPVEPSPYVKTSLMERIINESGPSKTAYRQGPDPTIFMLRASNSPWQETGVQGVQVRVLFIDRKANRQTVLVRMAPGTTYPSHPHSEPEECLVLEGDFYSAGYAMQAGDYQRNPGGSVHGETRTKNGCLLLVTSAAA